MSHVTVQKKDIKTPKINIRLTSDKEVCKVGDPRAKLGLGDTAVKVLVLAGDFVEIERSCEPSRADGFSLSHRNVFPVNSLENHHADRQIDSKTDRRRV